MTELWRSGYDPGDPDQFFLPDYWRHERARRLGVPAATLLSRQYAAAAHSVDGPAEAKDLAYRLGGRAVKPRGEIVLRHPKSGGAVVIVGAGVTEAAELQELAEAVCEAPPTVDFDALREREGLPARKDFDGLFRQAVRDRIAKHRANPITDPARQPHKLRGYIPVQKPGGNGSA